jgi:hypothetical protein
LIRKLILNKGYSNQDGFSFQEESIYKKLKFKRHIYNNKIKRNTIFITTFVEFGCESFFPHYIVPEVASSNKEYHIVVVGWFGREFYYKHLVDEFWELDNEFGSLRNLSRALQHNSKTLFSLEKLLETYGVVIKSDTVAKNLFKYYCFDCKKTNENTRRANVCQSCLSKNIRQALFYDVERFHSLYKELPEPNNSSVGFLKNKMPENAVAIFARNRKAYGRNLGSEFYIKLINLLKNMGYNPIWIGEPCSTLSCPDESIIDFTKDANIKDMEKTLSILKKCKFSIQFWTASTRLSIIAKIKYILIESPDQIYGHGQEGQRLRLFNKNKELQKLLLCNYNSFVENEDRSLMFIEKCIEDFLVNNNREDMIGAVDNEDYVRGLIYARSR